MIAAAASRPRRALRSTIAVVVAAVAVAVGAWMLGSSMAPSAADASVERADGAATAYNSARAESFEAAYLEAYEAANATGAADGTREGRIAGTAAAR